MCVLPNTSLHKPLTITLHPCLQALAWQEVLARSIVAMGMFQTKGDDGGSMSLFDAVHALGITSKRL